MWGFGRLMSETFSLFGAVVHMYADRDRIRPSWPRFFTFHRPGAGGLGPRRQGMSARFKHFIFSLPSWSGAGDSHAMCDLAESAFSSPWRVLVLQLTDPNGNAEGAFDR